MGTEYREEKPIRQKKRVINYDIVGKYQLRMKNQKPIRIIKHKTKKRKEKKKKKKEKSQLIGICSDHGK